MKVVGKTHICQFVWMEWLSQCVCVSIARCVCELLQAPLHVMEVE